MLVDRTTSRAEVMTPRGYDEPETSHTGFNTLRSDRDTVGRAYTIEWPSGWCKLTDVSSARSVGVDASFKNPRDEASTLAVFISDAGSRRSVADQGSLDKVAASRADSAPRQFTVGKRSRKTKVGDNGTEALTYDVETKVGGGTAGRFGSAVELVGITVVGGKEYLIRATASASSLSWLECSAKRTRTHSCAVMTGLSFVYPRPEDEFFHAESEWSFQWKSRTAEGKWRSISTSPFRRVFRVLSVRSLSLVSECRDPQCHFTL